MSVMEPHTEKLKYIFDNARVGIAICNAEDNKLEMVNPAFAAIHGYEPHELIGASPGEVFAPECMIRLEAHEQSLSCAINDVSFETTHIRKDGSPVPVSVHITVITDENGVIKQRIANIIDISNRKHIESALASREREFRSLADSSPGMMGSFYLRPDGSTCMPYVSPNIVDLFGLTPENVANDTSALAKLHHPDDNDRIFETIAESARTMSVWHEEFRIIHPTKGERWMESNTMPQSHPQGGIIWYGYIHDITERKQAEQRLQQAMEFNEEIINTIPDLLFELDSEGTYLNIWAQDEKLLAEQKALLIGKNIRDILPTDTVEICYKTIREVDVMGHSLGNMIYIDLPEGRKYFELSASIRKSSGTYIILSRDISERKRMESKLASREQEFRSLAENSPDHIIRYDRDLRILYLNPKLESFLGISSEHLIGEKITEAFKNDHYVELAKTIQEVLVDGNPKTFDMIFPPTNDRGEVFHHMRIIPEKDASGHIRSMLLIGFDITDRKKMESEIKKQKDFQNTLLLSIAEAGLGIHVIEDGKYVYTNDIEKAKQYGYDETIMDVKPNFLETIHPDDRAKALDMYTRRIRGEDVPSTYELGVIQTDGTRREHSVSVIVIPNTDPIQTIVVTQDITERKENEQKIYHMAHHDALTGLPNRTLAKIRAEQIMAQSKRYGTKVAFLFIDLDGFKEINDTLGHSVGDMMLKTIASRLKKFIRESDNISRQGGDEFLLILSDVQANNDIALIAKKILIKLEKPFVINSNTLSVSGSIGIATYPDHGDTFETLFQSADTAMYKAKESGKNSYHFYTQQMTHHMIGQFKIQSDLKAALEKDELILHYQPQIDLATNAITGVEALIRWRHPMLGMMPPMSFIPIAESSGLIVQIGQWVIEESCRQVALWHTKGIEIGVAVNISAMQFKRGNLEEIVKNAIRSSQINPDRLELELTESIIMHDADNTLQSVRNLKALGVQLSIDDFGTGYSSLSYLKRFAVDKLKIDQSFVRDILQDRDDAAIVKTIIQMAKNLNLKTIAEGVENAQVLSVIETYGCDEVQGYHFAKPMEASAFESFYKSF
ncbi:EAL domain-containing protein [Sulfuricurvum sp.]|uniref:EAL domain-containing protein n=1 Tax=Sulfuricurvum sp. TaxID=2025608 RepID=UPI0026103E18|nr:EAL domain-containing protein [Sulfuricurvum sp.]MDD2780322.1 EAL domain-containing protein [Sulfuricurvum sp.]